MLVYCHGFTKVQYVCTIVDLTCVPLFTFFIWFQTTITAIRLISSNRTGSTCIIIINFLFFLAQSMV